VTQLERLSEFAPGARIGAIMGWDGFFLFDENVDLLDMARAYMDVVHGASCGKCAPCRMGTRVASDILDRITLGKGREEDMDTLQRVGELVKAGSMCELGHTSMNAVLALLDHFEEGVRRVIRLGRSQPRGAYHAKVTAPCIETCPEWPDIPGYSVAVVDGGMELALSPKDALLKTDRCLHGCRILLVATDRRDKV
jgi:formate dehydrogenase beta subunit